MGSAAVRCVTQGPGAARSWSSCPFESREGLASQEARKGRLRAADVAEDLGGPVLGWKTAV